MSIWARDEQHRLVRVIPQRHLQDSIVRRLFQEKPNLQMEHPGNQQTHFNLNDQGLPDNPQIPYEPLRQGNGVASSATPARGGGNINFQQIQYRAPLAPLHNMQRTLQEILQPQRTTTNSCIRLSEEANQFLMKSEMIRLLLVYQGVDSKKPYSFMRDFDDVCSAFLFTGSPLHIICMVLFPLSL